MTPSERDQAFRRAVNRTVRAEVDLQRATRDDLVRLLSEASRAVAEILAAQPSDYQRWSLPQLSADINRVLDEFSARGSAEIASAAGDSWQLGIDQVNKPLDAAGVRIAATLPRIDTVQLLALRAFMVDRIKDIGADAARRISAQLGLVVIGARSPSEAIGDVKGVLGEMSRARATTIVRTELGRAFSVASQESLIASQAKLPGLKKQWRRSGKLHPRLHHDLADGQLRAAQEPFVLKPFGRSPVELMFPRDPAAPARETINCGCMSIPFMDSWKDIVAHPGRTPGSPLLDGSDETIAQVLARQKQPA